MRLRMLACSVAAGVIAAANSSGATAPREILFVGFGSQVEGQGVLAIRSDGTGLRLIATRGASPAWSPDGNSVVYSTASGLAIVPAAGGAAQFITNVADDSAPSWSPDGRWIAFLRYPYPLSLYAVRPDGTGLQKLRARVLVSPLWSPNSRRLLVHARRALATIGLAGHERYVPNAGCAGSGAWSPNGRWIAFAKCLRDVHGIVIEHPDGSGFRWLTRPLFGDDDIPVWAPDSKRLAYVRDQQSGSLDHSEIRMISIAGAKLGSLRSRPEYHDEYPRWSPDGRQIVFDRDAAIEPIGEAVTLNVGEAQSGRVRELYRYIGRGTESWRPH